MRSTLNRTALVAALALGLLGTGGTAALADDLPAVPDVYCDYGLPILHKLGYDGMDPRCN